MKKWRPFFLFYMPATSENTKRDWFRNRQYCLHDEVPYDIRGCHMIYFYANATKGIRIRAEIILKSAKSLAFCDVTYSRK